MSLTFTLFIVYLIIMRFFVKWKIQKKIITFGFIGGVILVIVFAIPQIGAIWKFVVFNPYTQTNESRPAFWNEYFLIGILMILSCFILGIMGKKLSEIKEETEEKIKREERKREEERKKFEEENPNWEQEMLARIEQKKQYYIDFPTKTCRYCQTEISSRASRCPHCTSYL